MPLKRVVFEKNAKDSYDIISRTPKISFIVPHKIEKLIKNKVKKKKNILIDKNCTNSLVKGEQFKIR